MGLKNKTKTIKTIKYTLQQQKDGITPKNIQKTNREFLSSCVQFFLYLAGKPLVNTKRTGNILRKTDLKNPPNRFIVSLYYYYIIPKALFWGFFPQEIRIVQDAIQFSCQRIIHIVLLTIRDFKPKQLKKTGRTIPLSQYQNNTNNCRLS